jgi:glycosyltransferase involved in cell wall biosynthesis
VEAFSTQPFPASGQLDPVIDAGGPGATLILQRVMPSGDQMSVLRRSYDRVVFDIDDAIYAVPPDVGGVRAVAMAKAVGRLALRGSTHASSRKRPLAHALREVDVCVVGNPILGKFARRFTRNIVEIPTAVDPIKEPPHKRPAKPVIVWLGVRANLQYLALIRSSLEALAREVDFTLRIVSTATWVDSPVPVDFVPYSAEGARTALLSSTVGLSPLTDDPWTRGKCAMRAIQYGGHALPAIASPVGITDRVVLHNQTGFLAKTSRDWLAALRIATKDSSKMAAMGGRALDHIRHSYSNDLVIDRWKRLLESP